LRLIDVIPLKKRPVVVGAREGMDAVGGRTFPGPAVRPQVSNFWVRLSGGPAVSDSQSGMRIYPLPEALSLPVRARRFQFEVEILVQARKKPFRFSKRRSACSTVPTGPASLISARSWTSCATPKRLRA
jgi:hypothetical protein